MSEGHGSGRGRRTRTAVALSGVPWLIGLLLAIPVAFGIAGVALPAAGFLPTLGATTLSAAPLRDLLAEPALGESVLLSLAAGLGTTALSLLAVLLFTAAFLGTARFEAARRALGPLLAIPHAAAAFGLALLIAPSGFLFRLGAAALGFDRPPDLLIVGDELGLSMMAGLFVKEVPFLLLVTIAALPQADPLPRLRVARALGYGRISGFCFVVWPGVYRQIRLPVLAVVAYSTSVVDVALILGPSTPSPLAVRILQWMQDPDLSFRLRASAGAMLQLAATVAALAIWRLLEIATRLASRRAFESGRRLAGDAALRLVSAIPLLLATLALTAGMAMLALWSVAGLWSFPELIPSSLSLQNWRRAMEAADGPLANSLLSGMVSAGVSVALVVVLLEARRRSCVVGAGERVRLQPAIAGLLYLPLIVPQICFVFGLQVLAVGLDVAPSVWLVATAHTIFVVPYVALALADAWFALDPRYERIAASVGRSALAAFVRVRIPLLGRAIAIAFAIGFATSVGQYLPSLLIGAGLVPTITTEAVALASGANPRVIGVYALLQALLPLAMFALATRLRGGRLPAMGRRGRG